MGKWLPTLNRSPEPQSINQFCLLALNSKKPNPYLKYAGLGFQMVAFILIFVGFGYKLDQWTHSESNNWLVGMALAGTVGSMIYMIAQFNRYNKNK